MAGLPLSPRMASKIKEVPFTYKRCQVIPIGFRPSRVLYSFEMAEPIQDQGEVSGVMISRESVYSPGKTLFLRSNEDQFLKILSIEPVSPSAKELAIYRFTAELMNL